MHVPTMNHVPTPIWKNSRLLCALLSHLLSSLGDWLDFIALLTLFTYVWQADPLLISMLPVAYAFPGILFSQAAGVWVDRWQPKLVLICTDVFRSGCTLLLLLAPSPYLILSVLLLRASIGTFHLPAQHSIIRRIVAGNQLLEATALIGISSQLTKIIGPMLGAFILSLTSSYKFCLLLTAICLAVSALLLAFLPSSVSHCEKNDKTIITFRMDWMEGWRTLLNNRILIICLIFSFFVTAIIQIVDVQLGVLLREIKPLQQELPGWIISGIGLGAVCSTAFFSRIKQSISYFSLLCAGALLMGSAVFLLGLLNAATPLPYFLLVGIICGAGTGLSFVGVQFSIQKETPSSTIGRVYGIYHSILNFVFIAAPLTGGWLVKKYGIDHLFLVCGFCAALLGASGFLLRKRLMTTKKRLLK